MKRFLVGSPRTQSAYKHFMALVGLTGLGFYAAYHTFSTYPVSFGKCHTVDIGLGSEQGESAKEVIQVRQQYSSFVQKWKAKGKEAQKKVWEDLKTFKKQQANMSVEEMQQFDKEANAALEKLDKV